MRRHNSSTRETQQDFVAKPKTRATGNFQDMEQLALERLHQMLLGEQITSQEAEGVTLLLSIKSRQAREKATAANNASNVLHAAQRIGLAGPALYPLWEQLTGTDARKFLPPSGETSSAAQVAGTGNQSLAPAVAG